MAISGGVPLMFYIIIGLVVLGALVGVVLGITLSGKKDKKDKPVEKQKDYFDL